MIILALCALAAGALAGIFLAARHFLRQKLPVEVALAHGIGGATGFALVLLVVVREPGFVAARQALYLLIATIALGAFNLLFHVRGVRHRTSLIVMHALCAVSGVGTLLYGALTHEESQAPPATPPSAPAPLEAPSADPVASAPAEPSSVAPPGAVTGAIASAAPAASVNQGSAPATTASELIADSSLRQRLTRPIGFASNGTELPEDSRPIIADIARALGEHPEIQLLEVQGHADERGIAGHNLWLTQQRAAAVVTALVAAGVQSARLRSAGYGSSCPLLAECASAEAPDSCHGDARWEQDRRVVLVPLRVGERRLQGEVVCARGAALIPVADRAFHSPR